MLSDAGWSGEDLLKSAAFLSGAADLIELLDGLIGDPTEAEVILTSWRWTANVIMRTLTRL